MEEVVLQIGFRKSNFLFKKCTTPPFGGKLIIMKKIFYLFIFLFGSALSINAQVTIQGAVKSAEDLPMTQVIVDVLDGNDNLLGTGTSGEDGRYSISGLPIKTTYYLRLNRKINSLDGVSTYDLVQMVRHILGKDSFKDPYQIIASDVNRTRSITTLDLIHLRRLILGVEKEFPDGISWFFIPDKDIPSGTPEEVLKDIKDLIPVNITGEVINFDARGVKLGDVNNSAKIN